MVYQTERWRKFGYHMKSVTLKAVLSFDSLSDYYNIIIFSFSPPRGRFGSMALILVATGRPVVLS